jgi:alpha-beta hydrolase superfamily lysophospholipase
MLTQTESGRFFSNQTYHYETLRALGYITAGGAEIGEVLETLKLITEGDSNSWYAAWSALTDRVLAIAERTNDPISKGRAYLRAHNYQRTGEFLLPADDARRAESWERTRAMFYKGLDTLAVPYERISVPYNGAILRALYFPGADGSDKRPLIVAVGGFDSILEELYFVVTASARERGYSTLLYEGPGQGDALRTFGLPFTHEWERPTSAVLDEFLRTHPAPARTVLLGMSMGGYLAPRAAAFDQRIDGVVAFDTLFDFGETARRILAGAASPVASRNPDVMWAFGNARWTMGTSGIEDTATATARYTLAPVADRIRQDVLILAGADDHFVPSHQTADFEKSLVNARSVTTRAFDRSSGGAQHCQAGALALFDAAFFDWLGEKFAAPLQ